MELRIHIVFIDVDVISASALVDYRNDWITSVQKRRGGWQKGVEPLSSAPQAEALPLSYCHNTTTITRLPSQQFALVTSNDDRSSEQ